MSQSVMCSLVRWAFTLLILAVSSRGYFTKDGCMPDEFDCKDDSISKCITDIWVCDGKNDCDSGSDENEVYCKDYHQKSVCRADQIKCPDGLGRCIPKSWVCDGSSDCENAADEKECPDTQNCKPYHFYCKEKNVCLSNAFKCDGNTECGDEDSEEDAHCECGGDNVFECKDKTHCLPLSKVCNGLSDCNDDSDEHGDCYKNCTFDCGSNGQCHPTSSGPQCFCNSGYSVKNGVCQDLDECDSIGVCDHLCTNGDGNFTCSCVRGYHIQHNKYCKADLNSTAILFYTHDKHIGYVQLPTKSHNNFVYTDSKSLAVAYDPVDDFVYWSTYEFAVYYTSWSKIDTPQVFINKNIKLVKDMKVDWVGRNLYMADPDNAQIVVCSLKSKRACKSLFNTPVHPNSIDIDMNNGCLFWTDATNKSILMSSMDGSNKTMLVSGNLEYPVAIAFDSPGNRLYWMDKQKRTIEMYDMRIKKRKVIDGLEVESPHSMAVWEDKIYWSGRNFKDIMSARKFDGGNFTILSHSRASENTVRGIYLYHEQKTVQTMGRRNPCNTASCSDLCLLTQSSPYFTCACPAELSLNQTTCVGNPNEVSLVVGSNSMLYQVKQRSFTDNVVKEISPRKHNTASLQSISDLDYDPINNLLYISDIGSGEIKVMDDNKRLRIIANNTKPKGLAVDWQRQNVYWVDYRKGTLEVANVKPPYYRTILPLRERTCKGIDVEFSPRSKSLVVLCDQILRCTRMGAPCAEIVDKTGLALGLSIGQKHNDEYVYWTTAYKDFIEGVSLDGKDKHRIYVKNPGGILFLNSLLYFTVVGDHTSVYKISDIRGAKKEDEIILGTKKSRDRAHMAITAIGWSSETENTIDNGCTGENMCKQLCLEDENGSRVCHCEIGKILDSSDGVSCVPKHCGPGMFTCVEDGLCISDTLVCDGKTNCEFGSDEKNCPLTCKSDVFMCNTTFCIPNSKVCDGFYDCSGGIDERNCNHSKCLNGYLPCDNGTQCYLITHKCTGSYAKCEDKSDWKDCPPCKENLFSCHDGVGCLRKELVCNEREDCDDGSDEMQCDNICADDQFLCSDESKCISKAKLCDGFNDCSSAEDEMIDMCQIRSCTRSSARKGDCIFSCSADQFTCDSNDECINNTKVCDGSTDCHDSSDESFCNAVSEKSGTACLAKEFNCGEGFCIDGSKVCDGKIDCDSGADENGNCQDDCMVEGRCSHHCYSTPSGARCYCRHNFRLSHDGRTCKGINTCIEDDPCDHFCHYDSYSNSVTCSCLPGYVINLDGKRCGIIGGVQNRIAVLSNNKLKLLGHNIKHAPGVVLMSSNLNASKIMYESANDNLIVLHPSGTVAKISVQHKIWSPIVNDLENPTALAYDSSARNIYISQYVKNGHRMSGVIVVCSDSKVVCRTLYVKDDVEISAIAVASDRLFFCINNYKEKVASLATSLLNCSSVEYLDINLGSCDDLAIDKPKQKTYIVDNQKRKIWRHSWGVRDSIIFRNLQRPVHSLEVVSFYLQWLEADGIIQRCPKTGSSTCFTPLNVESPNSLVTMATRLPIQERKECNTCEGICLPTGNTTAQCLCDTDSEDCWRPHPVSVGCDDNPCHPGGSCVSTPEGYMCNCLDGYSGRLCSIKRNGSSSNMAATVIITLVVVGVLVGVIFLYYRHRRPLLYCVLPWHKRSGDSHLAFPNPAFGASKDEIDATLKKPAPIVTYREAPPVPAVSLNADLTISDVPDLQKATEP